MTIKDCIDIVDNVKPNQYTVKDKVMWLSFLDEIIINEVLKTHEGYDGRYDDFEGYTEERLTVPLIVPSPYDRLYTAYLKMQIDKENGEMQRYNNSQILYNTYLLEYKKHYNKTHMPLDITKKESAKPVRKVSSGLSDAEYEKLKKDLTFILTEYFSNSVSADKIAEIVTSYMQTNAEMIKGRDGYTPKKGVDYFTEEEIEGIKADAKGDDGYSPVVSVTETAEGHNVTITDAKGTKTFNVPKGKDGKTPQLRVVEFEGKHRIEILPIGGYERQTFYVYDGKDGVSPTVSVEEAENGHKVSIHDAEGIKDFDVKDGVGVQKVEQTVVATEDDGVNLYTITLTDGTQTILRIKNGSKGGPGDKGDAFRYEDFTQEQKEELLADAALKDHTHELAGKAETHDVSLIDVAVGSGPWIEIGEKTITAAISGTANIGVQGDVDIEFNSTTLVQVLVDGVAVYDVDFNTMTQTGNTYYKGAVNDKIEVHFVNSGTFTFTKLTNTILKDGFMSGNQSKKLDATEIFTTEEKETVARVGAIEDASLVLKPFNVVELKESGKLIASDDTKVTHSGTLGSTLKGGTEATINVNTYVDFQISAYKQKTTKAYVDGVLLVDGTYKGYADVITLIDDTSLNVQFLGSKSFMGEYKGGYITGEQLKDFDKIRKECDNSVKAVENTIKNDVSNVLIGKASGEVIRCDVSPIQHELKVKARGKNLCDNIYQSGTIHADTGAEVNQTSTVRTVNYIQLKPNTTYTASKVNFSTNTLYFRFYDNDDNYIGYIVSSLTSGVTAKTFTTKENQTRLRLCIGDLTNNPIDEPKVLLEEGATATAYTPYVEDVSAVGIKVCGKNLFKNDTSLLKLFSLTISGGEKKDYIGYAIEGLPAGIYTLSPVIKDTITENDFIYSIINDKDGNFVSNKITNREGTKSGNIIIPSKTYAPMRYEINNGDVLYIYNAVGLNMANSITLFNKVDFQLEVGATATEFESYTAPETHTPDADGNISGIKSKYPVMTIYSDTAGVIIDAEYNKDLNKAFAEIWDIIAPKSAVVEEVSEG